MLNDIEKGRYNIMSKRKTKRGIQLRKGITKAIGMLLVTIMIVTSISFPEGINQVEAAETGTYNSWSEAAAAAVEGTDYKASNSKVTAIYTGLGLAYFATTVTSYTTYNDITVTLMDDIDLTSVGVAGYDKNNLTTSWTSIGTEVSYSFSGTFDGNGKTITGVYINQSSNNAGLFGYLWCSGGSAAVKDLTVEDVYITNSGDYNYVGAIAGYSSGATIQNCTVSSGTISAYKYVGGIVGYNKDGTIENCTNNAAVTASGSGTGGIAGYGNGGAITSCSNLGTVSGANKVGGIAGESENGLEITTCSNTATIEGTSNVGGVIGYAYKAILNKCYNTGAVSGGSCVGGITGYTVGTGGSEGVTAEITDCYSIGAVSGSSYVGGAVGWVYTTTTISNCYSASSGYGFYGSARSSYTITNCYYDNILYTGTANTYETGKTTTEMSLSSFATTLGDSFTCKEVDDSGKFYYPYLVAFGSDTASVSGTGLASEDWTAYAETAATETDYKYEASLDTLHIYTIKGLAYFSHQVSEGTYLASTVELEANLDLSLAPVVDYSVDGVTATSSWSAIGTDSHLFQGTFNGNNHTISGVYIDVSDSSDTTSKEYQGLFGYIDGATINDLTIKDSAISSASYMGNLVGFSDNSTISNCYNLSDITGDETSGTVGGLIGSGSNTTITNCYNTGAITGYIAGGLIGTSTISSTEHADTTTLTVKSSYNIGTITGTTASGLVGQSSEIVIISDCYNNGAIVATSNGNGIVYRSATSTEAVTISSCYNNATITGATIYAIGNGTTLTNCSYNNGKLSSTSDSATSLTSYEMSGDDAMSNMGLSSDNWTVTATVYNGFTSTAYYPYLISNQQTTSVETVSETYFTGAGTSDIPYEISSLEDLKTLSTLVLQNVSTSGIYFIQTADITLVDYTPIGTSTYKFNGNYNGGGYTISGSGINASGDEDSYKAMFGYTNSSAYISNLVIDTATTYIYSSANDGYYIAGIAGINQGTIENCYFTGSVRGSKNVGAIVGNNSGTVKNCYSIGSVDGTQSVGGIVGTNTGTVTGCYVAGTFGGGSTTNSGAVVGLNNSGSISDCYYLSTIYEQGVGTSSSTGSGNGITSLSAEQMKGFGTDCSNETMSGLDSTAWTFVSDSYPILTNNPEYLVVVFEAPNLDFTTFTYRLNANSTVSEPATDTAASYMKTGYTVGWYQGGSRDAFDFNTTITEITTLTAAWDEILATGIKLDKTTVTELVVDDTVTLVATVEPTDALDQSVTWSTSKSDVATVTDGVVTGVTSGTVTITATNSQGHTDTCEVTVVGKTPTTSVSITGWTYGDAESSAVGTTDSDGTISYQYSSDDKTFTDTKPSDAGTYYVKAYTSETSTYKSSESASYQFVIAQKEVTVTWVEQETSYLYTGNTLMAPTASYTDIDGSPVSLTVKEQGSKTFCDAGTYTFEATATDANYTLDVNTNTKQLSIAQATNTIETFEVSNYEYRGTATPVLESIFGASTVTYMYYEDAACEKEVSNPSDVGTYYVKATIAGTTNYTEATKTTSFAIIQKQLTADMLEVVGSYTYTGSAIEATITMTDGTLISASDYKVTFSNNINVGDATVIVTATTDGNYYGDITDTFEIGKAIQNIAVTPIIGKQYGDAAFTLSITGQKDTSGIVTYTVEDNDVITLVDNKVTIIGVGTVEITAKVPGDDNYDVATTTYQLTIDKADAPTIVYPIASSLTYGQTLAESTLTGSSTYGTFAWADSTTISTVNNDGYEVVFTPSADTVKYYETITDTTKKVNVKVAKKEVTVVINNAEIVRGMELPTFTGTVVGDYDYDKITPNYYVTADNMVAGTYQIGLLNASEYTNYKIVVTTGTLTITTGYTVTIYETKYSDVAYGTKLTDPNLAKKDGYYVSGWTTSEESSWTFSSDVVTKSVVITPTWDKEIEYTGEEKDVEYSSRETITLKASGDLSKFMNLYLDGEVIPASAYTATQGSTIISFTKDYISSLPIGEHTIKVDYTDGYAYLTLNVNEQEETDDDVDSDTSTDTSTDTEDSVDTGDASNTLSWFLVMLMCASCMYVIRCRVRRKK